MRKLLPIFLVLLISYSCSETKKIAAPTAPAQPQAMREFRAAWVATVANINWPSRPGLPVDSQKIEAIALLDFLQQHNFNAVILQVRPQADALYESKLEPWSYYLTGKQGQAPSPYYDPLSYWVEEAHNRGIELHVWINPYRAHHRAGKEISEGSIVKQNPELVVFLKEGYWWMDPARKEVQDVTNNVVMDIVNRYDIDGVHMDDYFYPYPSYNLGVDFPDSVSWTAYRQSGGKLSRGDWRRDAVNKLVERLYYNIRKSKPWVKFGVSPFGIWRPGYPESVEGFDQYEQLYADAKLWLNKGWLDYFSPQLYWPVNRYSQSYPVLLGWWASENTMKRHLWPGINVGRDSSDRNIDETLNEIMIDRGMIPESKGVVHWSISSVTNNKRLADTLIRSVYKKPALVPASPWMDNKHPSLPDASANASNDKLDINWKNNKDVFRWVVYYQYGNTWNYTILDRNAENFSLSRWMTLGKNKEELKRAAIAAVSRTGNESERKMLEFKFP
jgi:uncharacterized lipoprotein YddW (UPF0748 family)